MAATKDERLKVLQMLEAGTISPEEAAQLLSLLDEADETTEPQDTVYLLEDPAQSEVESAQPHDEPSTFDGASPISQAHPGFQEDIAKWRRWWVAPLTVGVLITTGSAWLVFQGTQSGWGWFWMFCIWLLLLSGILLTTLAANSRSNPWLHVRVDTGQDEWPRRIALSFPLPLRLTAWFLRHFGQYIPNMEATGLDEVIIALGSATTPEEPLFVEVDEGSGGERVLVFIG